MSRKTVPRALALLVVAVVAGCSEPLAPERLAGAYGWSGARNTTGPGDEPIVVVADTIFLRADGTGHRRNYARWGGPAAPVSTQDHEIVYEVRGRSIRLAPTCDDICSGVVHWTWYDVWGSVLIPREASGQEYRRVADGEADLR